MTYAEFKARVRRTLWPQGEAPNLVITHDKFLLDALIDLQKRVPCLQINHLEYVRQEATLFNCGATAFEAPPQGIITRLSVRTDDDQCEVVFPQWVSRDDMECMMRERNFCGLCALPAPYGYYYLGDAYYPYPELPLGMVYADTTTDKTARHLAKWASYYQGFIWIFPYLNSDEIAVLEWDGVKKSIADDYALPWLDEDGNLDREVEEAAELYLKAKTTGWEASDLVTKAAYWAEYERKRADLIHDCQDQRRMPATVHCFHNCGVC